MPTARLPKQKYVRMLSNLQADLASWESYYLHSARLTTSDHLAGRFSGRAYVLADAVYMIDKLIETLEGLPRVNP